MVTEHYDKISWRLVIVAGRGSRGDERRFTYLRSGCARARGREVNTEIYDLSSCFTSFFVASSVPARRSLSERGCWTPCVASLAQRFCNMNFYLFIFTLFLFLFLFIVEDVRYTSTEGRCWPTCEIYWAPWWTGSSLIFTPQAARPTAAGRRRNGKRRAPESFCWFHHSISRSLVRYTTATKSGLYRARRRECIVKRGSKSPNPVAVCAGTKSSVLCKLPKRIASRCPTRALHVYSPISNFHGSGSLKNFIHKEED